MLNDSKFEIVYKRIKETKNGNKIFFKSKTIKTRKLKQAVKRASEIIWNDPDGVYEGCTLKHGDKIIFVFHELTKLQRFMFEHAGLLLLNHDYAQLVNDLKDEERETQTPGLGIRLPFYITVHKNTVFGAFKHDEV